MTEWAYPDSFDTMGLAAQWVSVVGLVCCFFLLVSWAVLPVEKTFRHYLSICLTTGVALMSVWPPFLKARPAQETDNGCSPARVRGPLGRTAGGVL